MDKTIEALIKSSIIAKRENDLKSKLKELKETELNNTEESMRAFFTKWESLRYSFVWSFDQPVPLEGQVGDQDITLWELFGIKINIDSEYQDKFDRIANVIWKLKTNHLNVLQ